MGLFSKYLDRMSERKREGIRLMGIALVLLFTVIISVSVTSYIFTWNVDQSVASAPDGSAQIANAAAESGFSLGKFLVTDSFGLAAYCVVAFFFAWSIKLLWPRTGISLRKWFYGMLTLSFLLSWILAMAGLLSGWDTVFGGGPGGRAAQAVAGFLVTKFGEIITILLLAVLAALWLYCMSRRFADFMMGKKPEKAAEDAEPSVDAPDSVETAPAATSGFVTSATSAPEEPEKEKKPRKGIFNRKNKIDGQAESDAAGGNDAADGSEGDSAQDPSINVVTDDTLDQEVREPLKPIDNRLDPPDGLPKYKVPSLGILGDHLYGRHEVSQDELSRNNNKIRATLASYRIQVRDVTAIVGPTVTLYKVYPAPGVKIAAIKQLQEDIGISLNAKGVRITTLSDSVGIEVANDKASIVPLKSLLNDAAFRESKAELPVAIGYTISQQVKVFDLADAPHLLVAGATKQGKSVGLNVIVASLLYAKHPSELKFVFVDPKMVEFSSYASLLHHYLAVLPTSGSEEEEREHAIVKNAKDAAAVLESLCVEMDARYELLSKGLVNNIKLYNSKWKEHHLRADEGHHFLPYIVTVIDEYADLTMSVGAGPESKALARRITTSVIRLAQKGRAAGLHVILATQRPTVDVITGLIKANFPMRIAFRVTSRIDSATILDQPGADKLIGRGDMLLYSGVEMERVQCAFISNDEIVDLTKAVGEQIGFQKSYNTPYYLPEPPAADGSDGGDGGMVDMKQLDERFEEAARMVVVNQRGSTSDLQRRLGMGYAKAGRVMDQLEAAGIVGPQNGAKPREVLVKDVAELEEIIAHFKQQQ